MKKDLNEIRRQLTVNIEAVCRRYLSAGKKQGRYWLVGDINNSKGQSLSVRLSDQCPDKIGRWVDFATGEYGDVIDLIAKSTGTTSFMDTLDRIESFLTTTRYAEISIASTNNRRNLNKTDTAKRLYAATTSIRGSIAEKYLSNRKIKKLYDGQPLRFMSNCFYRTETGEQISMPALVAGITDLTGMITGIQRTYLTPDGHKDQTLSSNVKSLGRISGQAVRFGRAKNILLVGEGIETVLSLKQVMHQLPMAACLSANHLSLFRIPRLVKHLIIAQDNDEAGFKAAKKLQAKAESFGISVTIITPQNDDFNTDLMTMGERSLRSSLAEVGILSLVKHMYAISENQLEAGVSK
ncbi:DUF7146 domain-containing protein [Bartonella choladocola]|uniref:Toprim domain-containing protein n=1 Tax=Bartonella choladocola TaxID=2750995 RepID=A0A1U9MJR4_9HYPH|nr:toprim domain-containing protein [Bartonella choladocola]AQT47978.1 Toprim domain-containing protein [Bartonella choladocola]